MPLRRLNNKVRIISLMLAILGTALFGYALLNGSLSSREAAFKSGETATLNIATGLSIQVNLSFRAADLLIQEIMALEHQPQLPAVELQRLIQDLLARQSRLFPEMDSVLVIDEQGHTLQRWPALQAVEVVPGMEPLSTPSTLRKDLQGKPTELQIGTPVISSVTGRWIIPLTRLRQRDGHPAGLVRVGVSLDHFIGLFNEVDIGRQGSLVLATTTGTMLLRRPYGPQFLGKSMADLPLYRDNAQQRRSGWAMIRSAQDDVVRLNYFTRVPDYPLFVTAALSHDDMLADWREAQRAHLLVVISAVLLVSLLTVYLLRVVRMRDLAEEEIEKKNLSLKLLTENLRAQAMLDGMTGIPNRRYLDEQLQQVMHNASRSKSALSLVMFDVDYFKKYNDLYGHIQGDYCLQDIARTLRAVLRRHGDLAARYGGEEFALLLPDTDLAAAHRIAQKVLDAVRALKIPHQGNAGGVVTISAGVMSCVARADMQIGDIFKAADRALYRAKENGRDRVEDCQLPRPVVLGKQQDASATRDGTT
ncbi:diguanylate cyclase [Herbaspirillum sp. C9C3]|uniref:sensor domain-containing diguanylate cyclase n=1 Tax=Herbaspirillum sp. C9C3 TaxID=2735271 RepID=UPI001584A7F6|nr:diguanylate cyclase [Herbaspirillum sp. C9C3]NUT62748.1 diguanylate cyclase [Herbaspirillum sp. C9C3]